MKFAPSGYLPGENIVHNGAPAESAHAINADHRSTYLAAGYKFSSPATCVNPFSEIVEGGYGDKGWARFLLWVPPFTKYIGFEFWAMGSGTVTVSTPNDTSDTHSIVVPVDLGAVPFLDASGEWDPSILFDSPSAPSGSMATKDRLSRRMYGKEGGEGGDTFKAGKLIQSGPPMPNPSTNTNNRAIISPFKRFPTELEVHVKFENNETDNIGIIVWPFSFFYYTPGPTIDLTDAGAS